MRFTYDDDVAERVDYYIWEKRLKTGTRSSQARVMGSSFVVHYIKHLLAIGVVLAFGGTVASANPLLNSWVFSVDNDIFITGGTLSDLTSSQTFAIGAGGVTSATLSATIDTDGLGMYSISLNGTAGSRHVVSLWMRYYMTSTNGDGTTGSSTYSTGNYAGVGNPGMLPPNLQYQASDYTDLINNGFPSGYIGAGPSDPNYNPLSNSIAGQDVGSANVQGNDTTTWCCDPALGLAMSQSLSGGGVGVYNFGTQWVPQSWFLSYAGDPAFQQIPIGSFYLSEQTVIDSTAGQLNYFALPGAPASAPEPGTPLLIGTGALLVFFGKRRKRLSPR